MIWLVGALLWPGVLMAQSLPAFEEFTPLKQRQLFNRHPVMIVQFADNFCPSCERQIKRVEQALTEMDNTDFLSDAGAMFVDLSLWEGDPFMEDEDVRREPTMLIYHDGKVVARFVRAPAIPQVIRALTPLSEAFAPEPVVPVQQEVPRRSVSQQEVRSDSEGGGNESGGMEDPMGSSDAEEAGGSDPEQVLESLPEGQAYSPERVSPAAPSSESSGPAESEDAYEAIRRQLKPNEELIIKNGIPTIVVKQ
jgi:hypothetical protein